MMASVIEESSTAHQRDLSKLVTIFVLTIGGNQQVEQCLHYLRQQSVQFEMTMIKDVAPLSAALQRMLDECKTPFFIEIDEDMIVDSNAVESLTDRITRTPSTCAAICVPLWDQFIDAPIHGLKIYRHELARKVAFENKSASDWRHFLQLKTKGNVVIIEPPVNRQHCMGEHLPPNTPEAAFTRWRGLFNKHRRFGHMKWILPWPARLIGQFKKTHDELYLWAYLGSIVGAIAELPEDVEKDFCKRDPAYMIIADMMRHEDLKLESWIAK
jgi:hypothetical protein